MSAYEDLAAEKLCAFLATDPLPEELTAFQQLQAGHLYQVQQARVLWSGQDLGAVEVLTRSLINKQQEWISAAEFDALTLDDEIEHDTRCQMQRAQADDSAPVSF